MVAPFPFSGRSSMLRQSLLIGVAVTAFAGAGHAQQRRDDLLDALTRHIQICGEMTETQARLSCYDRLQTQIGGVSPPAAAAAPTPTPLQQAAPTPAPAPTPSLTPTPLQPPSGGGSSISSAPLAPQPLGVPGGGVATLGSGAGAAPAPAPRDPDAAFDPRSSSYRPPESQGPKPQPTVRRTGPRPVPNFSSPQPLVVLGAANLTYGESRYWQVTVTLTSNTRNPVTARAECTFMNAGQPVSTDYLGPLTIQPGEQITSELVGPPTTAYIDSTNCKLLSP
jgi:hypothetical protein